MKEKNQEMGLMIGNYVNQKKIQIGDITYEFKFLIDSINEKKLQGLKLKIFKWKRSGEFTRTLENSKTIPLSKEAYIYYKHILPKLERHPELNLLDQLKGNHYHNLWKKKRLEN